MKSEKRYIFQLGELKIGMVFGQSEQEVMRGEMVGQVKKWWGDFLREWVEGEKVDRVISYMRKESNEFVVKEQRREEWWKVIEDKGKELAVVAPVGMEIWNFIIKRELMRVWRRKGGIVVHGSMVIWRDKGLVFVAPSGGGKSTIAKLLEKEGGQHGADDVVFIEKRGGKWWVYGAPVIEKEYEPIRWQGEVGGWFIINKGKTVGLRKLSRKEGLERMLSQVWTETGMGKQEFKELLSLVRSEDIYLLTTVLDGRKIKEVIDEVV